MTVLYTTQLGLLFHFFGTEILIMSTKQSRIWLCLLHINKKKTNLKSC